MAHKSEIDELVQEVNVSLAMDPMAVGEMDLCFPQCLAPETAPNLYALSWRSKSASWSHKRATKASQDWMEGHKVCRELLFLGRKV